MDNSSNSSSSSKYAVVTENSNNQMRTPKSKELIKKMSTDNLPTKPFEMFYEDIALKPIDKKIIIETGYDKRFVREDKAVVFSLATFLEEGLVQTSFAFFGPLCWPWAIPLCTLNGLKITGFYPGKLIRGTSYAGFIMQTISAYCIQFPLLYFLYLYLTNNLVVYPESSILPTTYIFIPILVIVVRQVVIAVKYSFIPRRRMREERTTTRRDDEMQDDLLGSWLTGPRAESLAFQLDLALWRADLTGNASEEYITFVTPIPSEIIDEINLPEITAPKEEKKKKAQDKSSEEEGKKIKTNEVKKSDNTSDRGENDVDQRENIPSSPVTTAIDIDKNNNVVEINIIKKSNTISTNKIPLRMLIKYAAFKGTQDAMAPFDVVIAGVLLFTSVPLIYLGWNRMALFGTPGNSFEQYVCAVGWIHCFMTLASNLLLFPSAPDVIFKRSRFRLHRFFELLIPSTIVDAREYDPIHVENLFTRLPPMQPTSRNILMWNKGRKAIQKFGTFYRRRAEVFTAMYIMVVIIFAVYQIVSIFISTSIGITESMAFITIIALLVTIVILRMIFSGIKLNRQRKLMVAALKDYLVRVRLGSLEQIDTYVDRFNAKTNDNNNDDALTLVELKKKLKDDYKKIQKDAAEYHKAIKLVDGVMEAEEVTEKARILGITVDIQMLEFVVGLFGTTAYTIYQNLSGA